MNILNKKRNKIIFAVIIIIIISIPLILHIRNSINSQNLLYCQEYIVGGENIQGDVDTEYFTDISSNFAIGANSYGYAVFKDPEAAFTELLEDYSIGIALIEEEFDLDALSQDNYEIYGTYGWQVTTGTDEAQDQAYFVSGFMDIYENSFIDQR